MYYIDHIGRKILKSDSGTLTLRPAREYWTKDRFSAVPLDCRVHFAHYVNLADGTKAFTNSTTRSLERYDSRVGKLASTLSSDKKVIEIGAGLGEFIPVLVRNFAKTSQTYSRPIVIDPLDYESFLRLVKKMRCCNISDEEDEILDRSQYIAEIILNSSKVNLINTTLGTAVNKNPELVGKSDVVVDNWGAIAYPETEGMAELCPFGAGFRVKCIAQKLLSPEGILITRGVNARMLYDHRSEQRKKYSKR